MTAAQRNVLIALTAVVVLLVGVLVGLAAHRSNGKATPVVSTSTIATTSTSVTLAPNTTLQLVPLQPSGTVTATSTVPGSTTSSSSTSTTAPREVTGAGAILTAPASPDERRLDPTAGCASLADAGWAEVRCGVAQAHGAALTWLTEARANGGASARRAYVFRPATSNMEQVVLQAMDEAGDRFSSINVRVDGVTGDGSQDLVFGFRGQGAAAVLAIDLVHGPGVVTVHRDLYRGSARTGGGRLDTWSGVLGAGDSACCPSSYVHDTLRDTGGTWQIADEATVAPSQVPPSQV